MSARSLSALCLLGKFCSFANLNLKTGLIMSSFKGNIIFMLTSESHKLLKVLIEIIVQVFHDNNSYSAFLFLFFST